MDSYLEHVTFVDLLLAHIEVFLQPASCSAGCRCCNLWWWWSKCAFHNKCEQTFQWCDLEMWFMTLQTAVVKTLFIFHLFRHPSQQFFISSGILQQFFISSRIPHLFRHPSAILHLFRHPSSYQVNPLPILKTNFKGKALPILKTSLFIPGKPPPHSKDKFQGKGPPHSKDNPLHTRSAPFPF